MTSSLKSVAATIGLSAAALPSMLSAAEPVVLEPDQSWALDYGEDRCRLLRAFGDAENRHIVLFEQDGPSSAFGVTAAGDAFGKFRSKRKTSVQFGNEVPDEDRYPFTGSFDPIGEALIFSTLQVPPTESGGENVGDDGNDDGQGKKKYGGEDRLPQLDTERFAGIDRVTFSQGGRVVIAMTGDLEEPMKALNTCSQQFIADWGLDLDKHRMLTRTPVWTNYQAVSKRIARTYPTAGLGAGEQGIFQMRVMVDETGAVTDCRMVNTTAVDRLDSPACREMRNATFEPALDAEGVPMRSYVVNRVVYTIGR